MMKSARQKGGMGDKMGFTLDLDYYGALNLHKALLEAKFHENPDNELVSGSPRVADIYAQVRELLIKNDESGEWKEWFQLKTDLMTESALGRE